MELRELARQIIALGATNKQIVEALARAAEQKEREESRLVKRQPPAVKAGNMDV